MIRKEPPPLSRVGVTDAREAVAVLNRIHESDPTVLPALIGYRVPCNYRLMRDPTVQVGPRRDLTPGGLFPGRVYEVGLLGIINGLFGVHGESSTGYIGAQYDGDHRLVEFVVLPNATS